MLVIDMACECMNNKKTTRSEEDKKKLISRINRIKGQLDGINKMVEDDRYSELLGTKELVKSKAYIQVKETKGSIGGITYDETEHSVTINNEDFSMGYGSGVFELYPTKNIYQFMNFLFILD